MTEHNRALALRFWNEVVNAGNVAVLDDMWLPTTSSTKRMSRQDVRG